jgi:hypothetical protein
MRVLCLRGVYINYSLYLNKVYVSTCLKVKFINFDSLARKKYSRQYFDVTYTLMSHILLFLFF